MRGKEMSAIGEEVVGRFTMGLVRGMGGIREGDALRVEVIEARGWS